MGNSMRRLVGWGLCAGFVAVFVSDADGAGRRRRNYRRNVPVDNFYKAEVDANGNEIAPPISDADRYARYVIARKDGNRDHKLTRAEAGVSKDDFDGVDGNRDNYLDLKEVKAALQKFVSAKAEEARKKDESAEQKPSAK